jgi:hypothetical protein
MKTLIILLLVALTGFAHAGVVTLTAQSSNETNGVAELTVGPYELAEVISFPSYINAGSRLEIEKDGKKATHRVGDNSSLSCFDPVIVAGPASIRLVATPSGGTGMCTVRLSPEAFPPDRTILVPPGTNQARITLECSTNLVQWFSATNGVYGPLPEAKFFRIKLEPVQ